MGLPVAIELDAQYRQLREESGLLDRSGRAKLLVTGSEAADYLQGQLTNDIEALEPATGCEAALLDRKGHLQAVFRVLMLPDGGIWLDTEPAAAPAAARHLQMYKVGRDVEVEDVTSTRAILSLAGPATERVTGVAPGEEFAQSTTTIAGAQCLVVGTRSGIDLICEPDDAGAVREALLSAGAADVSEDAAEILRVEEGRPRFGADIGPENMPAEGGLVERTVSFTKGCYIGQEPVARLHYKGRPNRHLRGLRLSATAEPGAPLRLGEREVGAIGSAVVSPRFGPIALGIVRREAEPGSRLDVGDGGTEATVVELPFADGSEVG